SATALPPATPAAGTSRWFPRWSPPPSRCCWCWTWRRCTSTSSPPSAATSCPDSRYLLVRAASPRYPEWRRTVTVFIPTARLKPGRPTAQTSPPTPVDDSARPEEPQPPDERFWIRYSPHHEMPLSAIGSVLLHILLVVVIVVAYFWADRSPDS